jgi:hypothetical protein
MKMSFRIKRMALLSVIAMLLLLSILDISIRKEEVLEVFGDQFLNEQKTAVIEQSNQEVTATSQEQLEIEQQDVTQVWLTSVRGSISVKQSENEAIRLQYIVTASARNSEAAQRKAEAVKVAGEMKDGQLSLVTSSDGKSIDYGSISIDYELHIPDAMKLVLENEEGAVRIQGVQGDVETAIRRGMMEIVDLQGDLLVDSANAHIYLSNITGNIELLNQYGNTNIDRATGRVQLKSQAGRNVIDQLEGNLSVEAKRGDVILSDITGSVELLGQDGQFQLEHIRGDAKIITQSGSTTVILPKDEGYRLDAAVSGGRIRTQLPFEIRIDPEGDYRARMNGVVGDGAWNLDIKSRSGDIILHVQ